MRLAYADPPYPGQSARWYRDHPDYVGEVDHGELIARLAEFDGWALSTSAAALQEVLAICPPVRVACWYRPNSEPPGNRGTWWWRWEPVLICGGRASMEPTPDHLTLPKANADIPGQKPAIFAEWVFRLLGAEASDSLDDLFPGSGAIGYAWDRWTTQLPLTEALAGAYVQARL